VIDWGSVQGINCLPPDGSWDRLGSAPPDLEQDRNISRHLSFCRAIISGIISLAL